MKRPGRAKAGAGNVKMPTTGRVFVDSNVLLYAIDATDKEKQTKARLVLKDLIREGRGVISTQVVQEFYAIATKKLGVSPMSAKRALERFDVFELVTVDLEMILEAVDTSILSQISFWDALIVVSARSSGCKMLCSEDLNDSQVLKGVRVTNPFREVPHD